MSLLIHPLVYNHNVAVYDICPSLNHYSRSELTQALTSGGQNFTQQEIDALFNAADVNKDGSVDYEEFITLMCPSAATIVHKFRSQYKSIDDVRAAFKR